MNPEPRTSPFLRHAVLALLLLVACASRPIPPTKPGADVPVTPPPSAAEEKRPDAPPVAPKPSGEPIREETLGPSSPPPPPPATRADPASIAARLAEPNLPPRKKAALALVGEATELLARGQVDAAVRRLENAIGLDPSGGYAAYYLALVRTEQMRYDQALALCGQAYLKLGNDAAFRAKALALRARVHLALGDRAKAARDVASALAADPECGDALALKARLAP